MPIVLLAPLLAAPAASALVAANVADVQAEGENAVASCQLIVLVRAVVVLDLEDSLGLAAAPARDPVRLAVGGGAANATVAASCSVVVDLLRVLLPEGGAGGSVVTGPPVPAGAPAANAARIEVTGGAAASVCQRVVLVDSILIGGGALGLPTEDAPRVLVVPPARTAASGTEARCEVDVGGVEVAPV